MSALRFRELAYIVHYNYRCGRMMAWNNRLRAAVDSWENERRTMNSNRLAIFGHSSNQIKSFLLVYEAVKTTLNDQVGWWGYIGRVMSYC